MTALLQTPDLALLALGGVSLLMLIVGLVWRARRPREAAPARVRREALVPLEEAVTRTDAMVGKTIAPPPRASSPTAIPGALPATRVRGPARTATSAVSARQLAKSALLAGDVRGAAAAYRDAGLVDEAVNLLVGVLGAPEEAAVLLVREGRHERAAELYQTAGLRQEAAGQWAEVARRSAEPGKLLESIAALDWDIARTLADELAKNPQHPDAAAIQRAAALLKTIGAVAQRPARPIPREEPDEGPESQLSEDELEALADQATRVIVWRDEESKTDDDDALPPARQSYPSIVETPFEPEEAVDLTALADEAVVMARVGPTVEQLAAYVKTACTPSNVEVHHRVAVAMIARGAWNRAMTLLEGVEAATPGFRDAGAKSAAIALWRKRLGPRRFLAGGRYELTGEWRRHRHAVTFRGFDHTERHEVLLHQIGHLHAVDAALEACPSLRTFQTLLHPNVTRVFDVFLDDAGRVVVVTELSDGSSLKERVARSALPVAECLRVAVDIAAACEHLHARGLGMDELFPDGVASVPGGLVKLEPLGLGALLDGEGDHARHVAPYLAPEGHEPRDERCTVYALGAVLLHAITQRAPRLDERVTVESLKDLKVPGAFANIVARAMARDPAERFPSCNGMRLTLRSLLRQVHGRASQMRVAIPER